MYNSNHRPIGETISELLEATRAQAGIALWLTGEQALGNCQRIIDMAQQFEQRATSFRSFVEKLEADAERGEVEEAPIVEEGTEGVRIMTVHKAKGLEFPVLLAAISPKRASKSSHPYSHYPTGSSRRRTSLTVWKRARLCCRRRRRSRSRNGG